MKFAEIKDLSLVELKKKLQSISDDLFTAKMKNSLGQLGNPLEIRFLRKDFARLKTAWTKAMAAGPKAAAPAKAKVKAKTKTVKRPAKKAAAKKAKA